MNKSLLDVADMFSDNIEIIAVTPEGTKNMTKSTAGTIDMTTANNNMTSPEIIDLYDANPDMTMKELKRITGKSVAVLKTILMTGATVTEETPEEKAKEITKAAIEAPKKKRKKPAAAPTPAPAPEEKPVIETIAGIELKEGIKATEVDEMTTNVGAALDAIQSKDSDLLSHYITLGEFQSKVSPMFGSTKLYGQFLKEQLPSSQLLDPALRSNCKWLFEALNGLNDDAALLNALKVNQIEDFKSGNPTVIKREYKKALAKQEVAAEAAALGVSEEEAEAALKQTEADNKESARVNAEAAKAEALEVFKGILMTKAKRQDMADLAADLLGQIWAKPNNKEAVEFMLSFGTVEDLAA